MTRTAWSSCEYLGRERSRLGLTPYASSASIAGCLPIEWLGTGSHQHAQISGRWLPRVSQLTYPIDPKLRPHTSCRSLNGTELAGPVAWLSLARLPNLQVLNLFNNSLSGKLGPLPPSLVYFSGSMNDFSGGIPDSWADLPPALREVWVAYCRLDGTIPSDFKVRSGVNGWKHRTL